MGTLYLVRHGQASFGAADYDRLSELGRRQCLRLGQHLRSRGLRVDAAYRGSLQRQAQSLQAIGEGLGALPQAAEQTAWNEYDADAVVRALHPRPPDVPDGADAAARYRHHFRLLRDGLSAWMEGRTAPQGMPSHADFVDGVARALETVRTRHDGLVLAVSSGGPIATAVGLVLGLSAPAVIELNLRVRNSAVTEFEFSARRHVLVSFNAVPHLEHGVGADWVTYA
jgi:broad specificity phosphatase PhoE